MLLLTFVAPPGHPKLWRRIVNHIGPKSGGLVPNVVQGVLDQIFIADECAPKRAAPLADDRPHRAALAFGVTHVGGRREARQHVLTAAI